MKPDIRVRFAFIETRLYWGDGLTAQELAETFGLTRQTAQGMIDAYRRKHPGSIVFDASRKLQVAGKGFKPHYIRPGPGAFLDYLRGQEMNSYYMEYGDWSGMPFHDVDHLLRPRLRREPIRFVLSALEEQRAIGIRYRSKGKTRSWDFSPNHLIFAGNRYHIRGYCHLEKRFRDFILSRIIHTKTSDAEWISDQHDTEWHTFVDLSFKPNGELPDEAKDALLCDFQLNAQGHYSIRCRQALAHYVSRELTTANTQYGVSYWVYTDVPNSHHPRFTETGT